MTTNVDVVVVVVEPVVVDVVDEVRFVVVDVVGEVEVVVVVLVVVIVVEEVVVVVVLVLDELLILVFIDNDGEFEDESINDTRALSTFRTGISELIEVDLSSGSNNINGKKLC